MKVLFLDIDGVIATDASYRRWRRLTKRETFAAPLADLHGLLDPVLCDRVRKIVTTTGAAIVVSSSWRSQFDEEALCEFLGAHVPRPIGCTPPRLPRGEAVALWLDANGVRSEDVVLLDDSDCGAMNGRRVQTSARIGVQRKHVERAIAMLGGPVVAEAAPG